MFQTRNVHMEATNIIPKTKLKYSNYNDSYERITSLHIVQKFWSSVSIKSTWSSTPLLDRNISTLSWSIKLLITLLFIHRFSSNLQHVCSIGCWKTWDYPHSNIRILSGRKPWKIGIELQYPNDISEQQGIVATKKIKQTRSKNSNYNESYSIFSVLHKCLPIKIHEINYKYVWFYADFK